MGYSDCNIKSALRIPQGFKVEAQFTSSVAESPSFILKVKGTAADVFKTLALLAENDQFFNDYGVEEIDGEEVMAVAKKSQETAGNASSLSRSRIKIDDTAKALFEEIGEPAETAEDPKEMIDRTIDDWTAMNGNSKLSSGQRDKMKIQTIHDLASKLGAQSEDGEGYTNPQSLVERYRASDATLDALFLPLQTSKAVASRYINPQNYTASAAG